MHVLYVCGHGTEPLGRDGDVCAMTAAGFGRSVGGIMVRGQVGRPHSEVHPLPPGLAQARLAEAQELHHRPGKVKQTIKHYLYAV